MKGAMDPERIWLKEYPKGVPHDVDTRLYASIVELADSACRRFADRTAFEMAGARLSYADVEALSRDFASFLQHKAGLKKGDRVAVMLPNLLQYPVAVLGILRAGMIVVNVNPLYTPRELEHQLSDSGARAIVVFENVCATLQQVLGKVPIEHVLVTQAGDLAGLVRGALMNFAVRTVKKLVPAWNIPSAVPLRTALALGRARAPEPVPLGQQDLAFLQYTGGTTGLSKGAALSHGNVVANVLQNRMFMLPYLEEGRELIVTALPLYHIFALTVNFLLVFALGGKNVLISNPRDMPGFVAELKKHRMTMFTGVNTLFNGLLHTPGFETVDFSGLKIVIGGGAAVQKAVAEAWQKLTGHGLCEGYGLSETSPTLTVSPFDKPEWNGTIGVPLPSTLISIRDDAGNEVPPGQPGELCAKGPQVMSGYWQKPEENKKAFTADGYFKTGDIAVMTDKGYFKIVDRKKDMILVSGFNVFPNEVEAVVAQCPGVLEAACIGVPDDKTGEAVKVFVVKKDESLTEERVRDHCKQNLTAYKVPRYCVFIPALPKSNVGKILRKELRSN